MHSSTILRAVAFSTAALAQIDSSIPSVNAAEIETAVEGIIPTSIAKLIPHETQAIDDLAAYVTSITAEPQFTSVVAALAQAVPTSVLSRLEEAPESYILELATGTAPSIFTALPTGVYEYFASVGEQALSILEQDTGLTNIPANLIPTGVSPASIPAYATGGYYYPTGVIPTGYAYPSGFATGATGASGSAGLRPTQNITSYNGQNASPTPVSFTGAAAPRKGAFGVAAAMAGVAMFFACR